MEIKLTQAVLSQSQCPARTSSASSNYPCLSGRQQTRHCLWKIASCPNFFWDKSSVKACWQSFPLLDNHLKFLRKLMCQNSCNLPLSGTSFQPDPAARAWPALGGQRFYQLPYHTPSALGDPF